MSMEDLYQEIVLEHSKRPRNRRAIPQASHRAKGHNPLCGDEIEVYLKVEDERIVDLSFQGQGCAISTASASLMSESLTGLSLVEARQRFAEMMTLLKDAGVPVDASKWGDLAAVIGVRRYPGRIKCASLAWHALQGALDGRPESTTE
ncbi:MAG: SUF system NifU family Fe-S cluster assembly protein [Opitutales bacterium]|nr:SUF system NifU family Fe-S cluster assembly protein [Opitutales bacterium]